MEHGRWEPKMTALFVAVLRRRTSAQQAMNMAMMATSYSDSEQDNEMPQEEVGDNDI